MDNLNEAELKVGHEQQVRRDAGRYTLEEAAKFVAENSNASADSILEKLKKAAATDRLTVYERGRSEALKNMPRMYVAHGKSARFALGDEEAYWSDLNDWREKYEPRLDCKEFPNPNTLTAAAKGGAVRGISKREIMAAFQGIKWDFDHWGKNLATPSEALKACRVAPGNKKTSALWNPADIGLYLIDEGEQLKKLDAVFNGLKDWTDEWQEKTALERN